MGRLQEESESIRRQWQVTDIVPTRHFVIDDLLPEDLAKSIYNEFIQDANFFNKRSSFKEKKRTLAKIKDSSPILANITDVFQLPEVVEKISQIVGMTQLEADPTLYAGGLSMMFKGDYLNPHIDNSHNGDREKYRRINLLYYVSPGWNLESGANFELWNSTVQQSKVIISKFNRLVVMETNTNSWHSVSPTMVSGPRCCVSNYYFSTISPDGSEYFHVTSFTGRPEEKMKRFLGGIDNPIRNILSKFLKKGRGKGLVRK